MNNSLAVMQDSDSGHALEDLDVCCLSYCLDGVVAVLLLKRTCSAVGAVGSIGGWTKLFTGPDLGLPR
jgi:hypothetical protein